MQQDRFGARLSLKLICFRKKEENGFFLFTVQVVAGVVEEVAEPLVNRLLAKGRSLMQLLSKQRLSPKLELRQGMILQLVLLQSRIQGWLR
mgnify:CR=1 FL=1